MNYCTIFLWKKIEIILFLFFFTMDNLIYVNLFIINNFKPIQKFTNINLKCEFEFYFLNKKMDDKNKKNIYHLFKHNKHDVLLFSKSYNYYSALYFIIKNDRQMIKKCLVSAKNKKCFKSCFLLGCFYEQDNDENKSKNYFNKFIHLFKPSLFKIISFIDIYQNIEFLLNDHIIKKCVLSIYYMLKSYNKFNMNHCSILFCKKHINYEIIPNNFLEYNYFIMSLMELSNSYKLLDYYNHSVKLLLFIYDIEIKQKQKSILFNDIYPNIIKIPNITDKIFIHNILVIVINHFYDNDSNNEFKKVFNQYIIDDSIKDNIFKYIIDNNKEKIFNKLSMFINSKKKYATSDFCPICFEETTLYDFDCIFHKYCIFCYNKINVCSICKIPKNSYYINLLE
uniref:Uncharacterized protein n=1 Tax=viral metagenome TaxID=1070528 RepID=A0A6C0H5J5_9ZZZZ